MAQLARFSSWRRAEDRCVSLRIEEVAPSVQFLLNKQVSKFMRSKDPVVSVDTKKKELIGAFKNGGLVLEAVEAGWYARTKVNRQLSDELSRM